MNHDILADASSGRTSVRKWKNAGRSCRALQITCVAAVASASLLNGEPSMIYGLQGEAWQAAGGPLPDFSYAGYQRGEKPLPDRTPDVSVKDFGATGDGTTDDTAAIQKAIDENPGKTIALPPGRYRLGDVVTIKDSGTVLQGEGPDKTVFVMPVPLQKIHPLPVQYPDTGGTAYAYSGGFISVAGSSGYYANDAQPVTAPAARGATTVQLSPGHPFKAGDEIVLLANDTSGQTLLKYLYRDDATDLSKAGDNRGFRHVSRVKSVDGAAVTLERPLRIELRMEWKPEARTFRPRLEEVGIEHLAFEFPDDPYLGHFTELGFNAVQVNGAAHSWVRNVVIRNADSGIAMGGSVFCTVTGVVLESKRRAKNPHDSSGHHGITVNSLDCLCTAFEFKTKFIHDLTVTGGSVGSVFSNGKGPDMSLDHHKLAPYENLFSNLDLGKGERVFLSGGHDAIGRHAGAGNTYWNLQTRSNVDLPEGFGPSRVNFIGVKIRGRGKPDPEGQWIESVRPGNVEPPDLHAAQLKKRIGGEVPRPAGDKGAPQTWTNTDGVALEANFGGLEGPNVILILTDGRTVPYPMNKLSPESQALARKQAGK